MPKAGELWLAEIPFTSGMASKLRPVLVLWEDMADEVRRGRGQTRPNRSGMGWKESKRPGQFGQLGMVRFLVDDLL